jgi:hypothetical protein
MRRTRPKYGDLSPEARRRALARAKLHVYVARGKVKKLPCAVCGEPKVEGHHEDHAFPLAVTWLCSSHHRARHVARGRQHLSS